MGKTKPKKKIRNTNYFRHKFYNLKPFCDLKKKTLQTLTLTTVLNWPKISGMDALTCWVDKFSNKPPVKSFCPISNVYKPRENASGFGSNSLNIPPAVSNICNYNIQST